MDRVRFGVACLLVAAYLAGAIYDAHRPSFEFPPGTEFVIGLAVAFLLGGTAIKRIAGIRFDTTQADRREAPREENVE